MIYVFVILRNKNQQLQNIQKITVTNIFNILVMIKTSIKLLTLILAIYLQTTESNAQFKRIGIKGGVNISTQRISNGEFSKGIEMDKFQNFTGATIGFLSQTSSNDIFVTDFGLYYSLKGANETDYSIKFHYIEMPLIFKIRIPIAGPVAIQGGFGPYLSYAFLAKETYAGVSEEDILSIRKKYVDGFLSSGDILPYSPFDWGIAFGGDVEVKLPNDCFLLLGFNYELGVAKISNDWALIEGEESYLNPGIKNNNMTISVSYLFDVTKKAKDPVE